MISLKGGSLQHIKMFKMLD